MFPRRDVEMKMTNMRHVLGQLQQMVGARQLLDATRLSNDDIVDRDAQGRRDFEFPRRPRPGMAALDLCPAVERTPRQVGRPVGTESFLRLACP